ncbi:MAG: DNA-3-methyladenine glycosylase [Christensenellaceae bacterium]|nr:DNA-3-methyladenine glycosylase [Christensenellaceae bacterium]
MKIVDRIFFEVPAEQLSMRLLGKFLCRKFKDGSVLRRRITETEAYGGFDTPDTACHAYKGKTARNAPLFGSGGTLYVFLCYGIFNLLNIISGSENDPQGVLIRGVEGSAGPGRVGRLFEICRSLSGKDIIDNDEIWLEDDGFCPEASQIICSKRIGIEYASDIDKKRLARFCLEI